MEKIIPEEFWLNPEDFNSWFVSDGTVENAMDHEMDMIENNRIDEISCVINDDFDRMLELHPEEE